MNKYLVKIICAFIPSKKLRRKVRESLRSKITGSMVISSTERYKGQLGKYSYCTGKVKIFDPRTTIGKYTSIAENTMIGPGRHCISSLSSSPIIYGNGGGLGFPLFSPSNKTKNEVNKIMDELAKPVEIGNDVWIAMNVLIKDGVKIGNGAVIGMGAVVTKDVSPYAVVGGVPAKIIRYRFSEEIIKDLLELKWWDLDEETISKLSFFDINKAIEELKIIRSKL